MILTDLRHYLKQRRQASLEDIAHHLDSDPEAVRGMLEHWIRKGRVRRHIGGASCGGCTQCEAGRMEVYEWLEAGDGPAAERPGSCIR